MDIFYSVHTGTSSAAAGFTVLQFLQGFLCPRSLGHGFSHFPLSPVFVKSDAGLTSWRKIFTQNSVISPEVFLLRNFLMGSVERSLRTGGWRIKNSNSKLIGANQLIVCLISTNYLTLWFSWFTKLFIIKEWFTLEKICTFLSKAITVHWQNCSVQSVAAQNPCITPSTIV